MSFVKPEVNVEFSRVTLLLYANYVVSVIILTQILMFFSNIN